MIITKRVNVVIQLLEISVKYIFTYMGIDSQRIALQLAIVGHHIMAIWVNLGSDKTPFKPHIHSIVIWTIYLLDSYVVIIPFLDSVLEPLTRDVKLLYVNRICIYMDKIICQIPFY